MDVKTAFLNGEIDKEIYIEQPQGYREGNLVCKLRKSLYGLKQSPRLWNKCIDTFLLKNNFKRCISDPSIYCQHTSSGIIILGIWVDDIIIVATPNLLAEFKTSLCNEFKMTDQGEISFILGISVIRDRRNHLIHLHQPRYISEILTKFNMSNCNPSSTPADISVKLSKSDDIISKSSENIPYRQAVGSLMYLMLATRPDIAAAVNKVA